MTRRGKRRAEYEVEDKPRTRACLGSPAMREEPPSAPTAENNVQEETVQCAEPMEVSFSSDPFDVAQPKDSGPPLKGLKQEADIAFVTEQESGERQGREAAKDEEEVEPEEVCREFEQGSKAVEEEAQTILQIEVVKEVDWTSLPDDALVRIFDCLGFKDVARLACVCKAWSHLSASPSLWTQLDVRAYAFDARVAESLSSRCQKLQQLRFRGGQAAIAAVKLRAQELKMLKSDYCLDLTDASVAMLAARHMQLEVLHLADCSSLSSDAVKIVSVCCPKLRKFRLGGVSRIDAEAVNALAASCPQLADLALLDCGAIDEAALTNMSQLRLLSVAGSGIQWGTAGELWGQLADLEGLDVSRTEISPSAASRFLGFPNLKVLCAMHCPFLDAHPEGVVYSPRSKVVFSKFSDINKGLRLFVSGQEPSPAGEMPCGENASAGAPSLAGSGPAFADSLEASALAPNSQPPPHPLQVPFLAVPSCSTPNEPNPRSQWWDEEAHRRWTELSDWLELALAHNLQRMSERNEAGMDAFWLQQGAPALVKLLESEEEDVQERAANALGTFVVVDDVDATVDKGKAEVVLKCGGIPLLLGLAQSKKEGMQAEAAKALANLSVHFDIAKTVAQEGGIKILTSLALSQNKWVVEEAAGGLWNLSVGEEHKKLIAAAGGISVLIGLTARTPAGSEGILERAAGALANLAADDTVSMGVAAAGGVKALVQVARFCKHDGILEQAARALGNLAAHGESNCHMEAVGREPGALEALVHLTSSPNDGVRQEAAGALWNLSFDDRNREAIAAVGGVEALVALARACTHGSVSLQERAAGALWGLSVSETNSIAIGREGGVGPLIMLAQAQSEDVHETAAGALWNLAFSKSNAVMIVEEGGVPALVQLCRASHSSMARFMAALALAYMFDSGSCAGSHMAEGRQLALPSIEAFLRSCMEPGTVAAAGAAGEVGAAGEAALARLAQEAGIPEAGHLRCSGAELARFVRMLRNSHYPILRTCAAFALFQFTLPSGKHALHHTALLRGTTQGKGEGHRLRSAAALAHQTVEAKAFIRGVLRNLAVCETRL